MKYALRIEIDYGITQVAYVMFHFDCGLVQIFGVQEIDNKNLHMYTIRVDYDKQL